MNTTGLGLSLGIAHTHLPPPPRSDDTPDGGEALEGTSAPPDAPTTPKSAPMGEEVRHGTP